MSKANSFDPGADYDTFCTEVLNDHPEPPDWQDVEDSLLYYYCSQCKHVLLPGEAITHRDTTSCPECRAEVEPTGDYDYDAWLTSVEEAWQWNKNPPERSC